MFAPSLFIGCMLGGAFGDLVHGAYPAVTATGGAYALVGMGAVFAGAAHAPMTAIIILFEMTGDYRIIGPLMIATVVSSLLSEFMSRESIYTLKLSRRGVDVIGARPDLLATIPVAEAMTTEFDSISPETPVSDAMERLARGEGPRLPVGDGDGTLVGVVWRADAGRARWRGWRGERCPPCRGWTGMALAWGSCRGPTRSRRSWRTRWNRRRARS